MTPKQEDVLWRAFINHLLNNVRCLQFALLDIFGREFSNAHFSCALVIIFIMNSPGYDTRCCIYAIKETLRHECCHFEKSRLNNREGEASGARVLPVSYKNVKGQRQRATANTHDAGTLAKWRGYTSQRDTANIERNR